MYVTIACYFACDCGMAHYKVFQFSNMQLLGKWLLTEYTNIESIVTIQ